MTILFQQLRHSWILKRNSSPKPTKAHTVRCRIKIYSSLAEITLFEGTTCVHRTTSDIYFYIIGDVNENELMLMNALTCLHDAITQILRNNLEKRALLDNLELIYLSIDELCDGG